MIITGEKGEQEMKRNIYKNLLFATLFVVALIYGAGAAHAALSIEYSISDTQPANASVHYDPNGDGTLRGVNLSVTGVRGNETAKNPGVTLAITDGNLAFQTGALTSLSGSTYYFGSPGSFTLTGGISALGLNDANTNLVSGHFISASVTSIDLNTFKFEIVGAALNDYDNSSIYSYFGVPEDDTCSNALALSFIATTLNGSGFTSTNITGGTLVDTPVPTPIPAAAWLLGSGLAGLAGIRRRMGK